MTEPSVHSVIIVDGSTGNAQKLVAFFKDRLTAPSNRAEFLGCFVTEIGLLNRVLILHRGPTLEALAEETSDITSNPELAPMVREISTDFFRPFPFVPPVTPGKYGPIFEIRTYTLRPNALGATKEAWEKALPARTQMSKLVTAMGSITGTGPRILQIWPYASIQQRFDVRAKAGADRIWPPPGGVDRIQRAQSEIYLAAPFSPIN